MIGMLTTCSNISLAASILAEVILNTDDLRIDFYRISLLKPLKLVSGRTWDVDSKNHSYKAS